MYEQETCGHMTAYLFCSSVLEDFDILFGTMVADYVAHIEIFYDNGYKKLCNYLSYLVLWRITSKEFIREYDGGDEC